MRDIDVRACFVVPICKDKIMIQERADGTWSLFGGGRQGNEESCECIRREFFEETGIALYVLGLGLPLCHEDILIYPYVVDKPLMNVLANIETKGFSWVKIEDLGRISLHPSFEKYLEKFIRFVSPFVKD